MDREWLSLRRQAEGYCQHNTLESPDDSCRGPERAAEAFDHALAAADGPPLYMPSLQDPRAVLDRAQGGDIAMPPPWPNPTLA